MDAAALQSAFTNLVLDWLPNSYSADVRFLAFRNEGHLRLAEALIAFAPIPPANPLGFRVQTNALVAGQQQLPKLSRRRLQELLDYGKGGRINVDGQPLSLGDPSTLRYSSDMINRERWEGNLHLKVASADELALKPTDAFDIDNELRIATPPFDGLRDLFMRLGFSDPLEVVTKPALNIRVLPPVDIIFQESSLNDNILTLTLRAHSQFNVERIRLAIVCYQTNGGQFRNQMASQVKWSKASRGIRAGKLRVPLENANAALSLLMIGSSLVRRQWFIDPARSANRRFIAVQTFDKELRKLKEALLETQDSRRFESGVAALAFLLGFSPVRPVETDSPDIILMTPGGKLAVAECTIKVSDVHSKIGKLVDRRRHLSNAMADGGHLNRVDAFLICLLPRDHLAAQDQELKEHGITLITKEQLQSAVERLQSIQDPDKLLDDYNSALLQ